MKPIISLFLSLSLFAAVSSAEDYGYVVKVDSDTVYMDTSLSTAAVSAGMQFTVTEDGEELINPVTNASLGKIENTVAEGAVVQVQPKYAVGKVILRKLEIKPGQKVKWGGSAFAIQPTEQTPAQAATTGPKKPIWSSKPMDATIISIALADLNADGLNELVTASSGTLKALTIENGDLKTIAEIGTEPRQRIFSVEAADMAKTGKSFVFMTYYDSFFNKVQTIVYELDGATFKKVDSLKQMVKAFTGTDGVKRVATQEMFDSEQLRFSTIRELSYKDGKFSVSSTPLKNPRLTWLFGFTLSNLDSNEKDDLIYTTESNKISLQFEKRRHHMETDRDFGKTPNKLNLKEEIMHFYPRVFVFKNQDGSFYIYAMENVPDGLFSDTFARYKDGEIHRLKWDGAVLKDVAQFSTIGYAYEIEYGSFSGLKPGFIVPSTTLRDETFIRVFEP